MSRKSGRISNLVSTSVCSHCLKSFHFGDCRRQCNNCMRYSRIIILANLNLYCFLLYLLLIFLDQLCVILIGLLEKDVWVQTLNATIFIYIRNLILQRRKRFSLLNNTTAAFLEKRQAIFESGFHFRWWGRLFLPRDTGDSYFSVISSRWIFSRPLSFAICLFIFLFACFLRRCSSFSSKLTSWIFWRIGPKFVWLLVDLVDFF